MFDIIKLVKKKLVLRNGLVSKLINITGDIVLPSKFLLPFLVEKPQHCQNFWHQSLLNTLWDIVLQKNSFSVKENVKYVIQFRLSYRVQYILFPFFNLT
jgi:hypothetical protein